MQIVWLCWKVVASWLLSNGSDGHLLCASLECTVGARKERQPYAKLPSKWLIRSLWSLADALERPRASIKRCPDKIQASGRPLARSVEASWLKEGTCSAPRNISAFQGRYYGSDGSVPKVTMLLLCEWKDGAEAAE